MATDSTTAPAGRPRTDGSASLPPGGPGRDYDPFAGFLSYLVPGLGQIVQGRVGKGLLFLVCIATLFFYGMHLGRGSIKLDERVFVVNSNVFLPDSAEEGSNPLGLPPLAANLYNRPQFAGQFWVGIAAWPAILQYIHHDRKAAEEFDRQVNELYQDARNAAWNNDPETAAQKAREAQALERGPAGRHPFLGDFQREPDGASVNAVFNAGDKRLELAWVYTVIAGVLNIMVIYDAVAGPAYAAAQARPAGKETEASEAGPAKEGT